MSNYREYLVVYKRANGAYGHKKVDALDAEQAKKEGSRYGSVLKVSEVGRGLFNRVFVTPLKKFKLSLGGGLSDKERIEFLQILSTLLVGYKLPDALNIIIQNFNGMIKYTARVIRDQIEFNNKDFTTAMSSLGGSFFPPTVVAIIKVNEKVSSLVDACKEGLSFQKKLMEMKGGDFMSLIFAFFYFVFVVLLVWVMGKYLWMGLESFDYFSMVPEESETAQQQMKLVKELLNWCVYLSNFVFILVALVAVLLVMKLYIPAFADGIIQKIPILNRLVLYKTNFIYLYQMHKLLDKGISLPQMFDVIIEELPNGILKKDTERAFESIKEGNSDWGDSFYSFTDLDRSMLRSATDQEDIANVFLAQSERFYYLNQLSVKMVTKALETSSFALVMLLTLILTYVSIIPAVGGFDMMKTLR
jgi:type II secretory pathway component PulF